MRRKCIMVTSIYIPGTLKRMHLQHEMDRNPRCKPIHWKHQGLAVTVLAPSQRATVQIAPGRLEAYPFAIFPYTYGFGVSGANLSETTDLSSICVDWQAKSGMSYPSLAGTLWAMDTKVVSQLQVWRESTSSWIISHAFSGTTPFFRGQSEHVD